MSADLFVRGETAPIAQVEMRYTGGSADEATEKFFARLRAELQQRETRNHKDDA